MKIAWLTLLAVIVLGYQNCGSFATDPLLKASDLSSVGSTPGSGVDLDVPYADGFAVGASQKGLLFARDPSTTASNDRLSFSADLSAYTASGTIKHLDASHSYLSDPYISVSADDFYSAYASPSSALTYAPSDQRFQQVNAYYHADRVIAELSGLSLFPGGSYSPITVKAHCAQANNAFFDTDARQLCLGYSTISGKKVWAADDTDVITHEFGHSLNHLYSPDPILYSTTEMGALDEAFADLWAYRATGDPRVSVWFGRAILSPSGTGAFAGLRNLDSVKQYPADVVDEVHDDSLFLSTVVKNVEATGALNTTQMATFEKHLLESLQLGHGFTDVISILQTEAASWGVSLAQVNSSLSARGLYRKDLISEIALDGTKPFYLIDNHDDSNLVGGNCNGVLDSGERVILFPNIRNTGVTAKGAVTMTLTSNTGGVTVVTGGNYAFAYRIPASTTYLAGEMSGASDSQKRSTSSDYKTKLTQNAFYIQAAGGFSGAASLTLHVKSMNTMDGVAQTSDIPISLMVGSTATATSCTAAAALAVYP